jgi:hypothetical protein
MTWAAVIAQITNLIVGLIIGFTLGFVVREVHDLHREYVDARGARKVSEPPVEVPTEPKQQSSRWDVAERVFYGVAILALIVAGVSVIWGQRTDARQDAADERQETCAESYANRLADALEARQAPADQLAEDEARQDRVESRVDRVVLQVTRERIRTGTVSPELSFRLNEVLTEQVLADASLARSRAELAREREENPYPEPPRVFCQE